MTKALHIWSSNVDVIKWLNTYNIHINATCLILHNNENVQTNIDNHLIVPGDKKWSTYSITFQRIFIPMILCVPLYIYIYVAINHFRFTTGVHVQSSPFNQQWIRAADRRAIVRGVLYMMGWPRQNFMGVARWCFATANVFCSCVSVAVHSFYSNYHGV